MNDKFVKVAGGHQCIKTGNGYIVPLIVQNGLPQMHMHPPTDKELRNLLQTILTQPEAASVWDPTVLDFDLKESNEQWFDAAKAMEKNPYNELLDEYGHYRHCVIAQLSKALSCTNPNDEDDQQVIDRAILHAHYCEMTTITHKV